MSIAAGAVGAVVFACIAGSSAVAEPETSVAGATDGWYSTAQAAAKWHVKMATPMVAALTPTAGGLLFTGNLNGEFMALDAATGDVLYRNDTRGALAGGVITYRAGGTQYVAAASGNTSFVAWTITGKPTLMIFGL